MQLRRHARIDSAKTRSGVYIVQLPRPLAYLWASPATVLGLPFVVEALFSGRVDMVDGVIEAQGRLTRFYLTHCTCLRGGALAMTLGHVVIGRNADALVRTRAHERVHVRQCERWGPFFIPAYLTFCAVGWIRGLHPYEDNPFEREAFGESLG